MSRAPTVIVHGFMFDPADRGGPNDPEPFFEGVRALIGGPDALGVGWYSAPFGLSWRRPLRSTLRTIRTWCAAWRAGHLHPYRHAWALADETGRRLSSRIALDWGAGGPPVDLVAHSLGTRVALIAASLAPAGSVRRVVLLNGAELATNARRWHETISARVLNVAVQSDDVLALLGSRFSGDPDAACIGQAGLGVPRPGWTDIVLDDPDTQARARQGRSWILSGDNPRSLWDHWQSYRFPGNADLIRAWLAGDDLEDLTQRSPQLGSRKTLDTTSATH